MDDADAMIVALLERDGRASWATVGARVGLSPSAVKRRVDRLVASGRLRFTVEVCDEDDSGAEAVVELFCRGVVSPTELRRMLLEVPEVVSAATVTGAADAIIHLRACTIGQIEGALTRIRAGTCVASTRSAVVLTTMIPARSGS